MASSSKVRQSAIKPAAVELEAGLEAIVSMGTEDLRTRWQQIQGQPAPASLSRDILVRALTYWLQEANLGGLDPQTRKMLANFLKGGEGPPSRRVKVGSVVVREYQGQLHEVLVVPDGFCWQGQIFASLSTIARKITGTSWNGPRFFGLRGSEGDGDEMTPSDSSLKPVEASVTAPSGSINVRRTSRRSGAVP